jgi:phage-related tail protein
MAAAAGGFRHSAEAIGVGAGLCLTSESTLVAVVGASLRVLTAGEAAGGAAAAAAAASAAPSASAALPSSLQLQGRAALVAPPPGAAFTAIASAPFSR